MKYKVDLWNNFCRVFEVPNKFPEKYCFNGGHPVNFQMVDWFCPTDMGQPAVSKEVWEKEVGPIQTREFDIDELAETIVPFLRQKNYTKPGRRYLVICDFGGTICFDC